MIDPDEKETGPAEAGMPPINETSAVSAEPTVEPSNTAGEAEGGTSQAISPTVSTLPSVESTPPPVDAKPDESKIVFGLGTNSGEITASSADEATESSSEQEPEPVLGVSNEQSTASSGQIPTDAKPWSTDTAVEARVPDPVAPIDSPFAPKPEEPKPEEPKTEEEPETAEIADPAPPSPAEAPVSEEPAKRPWWKIF